MTFTQADVDAFHARQLAARARRNRDQTPQNSETASEWQQPSAVSIPLSSPAVLCLSASKGEAGLNKTEKKYLARLREDREILWVGIQNVTLKLGHDCRFTPDFCYLKRGRLTFVDTKGGFIREDSTIKIKSAARQFQWAAFVVAQLKSGNWTEKEIKP